MGPTRPSTVTVNVRSLVLVVVVSAALVVAYVLGVGSGGSAVAAQPSSPAAAPPTADDVPSIQMTGAGSATAVPDQLTFQVGVSTTATDVSTALDSANATTREVLAAVGEQGVDPADVQTTGLNIRATYDYGDDGPPVITGYAVSQDLSVLVRSLPDAGATISAAAEAGGNAIRLHGIRLQVADEDAVLRQARAAAVADAQAKAQQYAAASGAALGEVLSVREVSGGGGVRTRGIVEAAAADAISRVPIRAGRADLEVRVAVVWSLA